MSEPGDAVDSRVAATVERALQLCARPTASARQQEMLAQLLARGLDWTRLLARAESEGLGALLYSHFKQNLPVPAGVLRDMRAMQLRHRALFKRRSDVLERVVTALHGAELPFLLLKGSAVSLLAYPEPYQRCMRDLDILVRAEDARSAAAELAVIGFRCPHEDWDDHYHLSTRDIDCEGVTVSVELHKKVQWELPWTLEERFPESQPVRVGSVEARTLGPLDTLWLAYLHGFGLSMEKSEGFRLIWVADMHALVEAFCARSELKELQTRHPKLWRALPWFGVFTPWSDHVVSQLGLPVLPVAAPETEYALPLSAWRTQSAWARATKAPLAWAGIRHGLDAEAGPRWITRARQLWIARSDR